MSPTEQSESTSPRTVDAVEAAMQQQRDEQQQEQQQQQQQREQADQKQEEEQQQDEQQEQQEGDQETQEDVQEEQEDDQEEDEEQSRGYAGYSVFNTPTGQAPVSAAGGDRTRFESSESSDFFDFLRHHSDDHIHVFDEPPEVHVVGGRSEDSWPTRYVEYDVEVRRSATRVVCVSLYVCSHYCSTLCGCGTSLLVCS